MLLLIKKDYRYTYLIFEAMEQGNIKRIKSFVKMGALIPISYEEFQNQECK